MLEDFVEDLLVEKGLTDLDSDVRFSLIAELVDKANQFVNQRLLQSLSEAQLDDFNKLIDNNPDQAMIQDFVDKNVPNKEQLTAQALFEFKALYLGEAT